MIKNVPFFEQKQHHRKVVTAHRTKSIFWAFVRLFPFFVRQKSKTMDLMAVRPDFRQDCFCTSINSNKLSNTMVDGRILMQ